MSEGVYCFLDFFNISLCLDLSRIDNVEGIYRLGTVFFSDFDILLYCAKNKIDMIC